MFYVGQSSHLYELCDVNGYCVSEDDCVIIADLSSNQGHEIIKESLAYDFGEAKVGISEILEEISGNVSYIGCRADKEYCRVLRIFTECHLNG